MERALDDDDDIWVEVMVVVKADVVAAAIAATKSVVYDGIMGTKFNILKLLVLLLGLLAIVLPSGAHGSDVLWKWIGATAVKTSVKYYCNTSNLACRNVVTKTQEWSCRVTSSSHNGNRIQNPKSKTNTTYLLRYNTQHTRQLERGDEEVRDKIRMVAMEGLV